MDQHDEKVINLTADAKKAASALQIENNNYHGLALRLYLDGKGCDGFYYGVCFDAPIAGDLHFSNGTIDVVVDKDTFEFVSGSTIDWVDDTRGRGFLVNNPNHNKYRGKFYRAKTWQERLEQKRQSIEDTI